MYLYLACSWPSIVYLENCKNTSDAGLWFHLHCWKKGIFLINPRLSCQDDVMQYDGLNSNKLPSCCEIQHTQFLCRVEMKNGLILASNDDTERKEME